MRWIIYFSLPLFLFYSVKTNAQNNAYFPVKNFYFNEYHSEKSIPNPFLSDYEEGSIFTRDSFINNNKTYYKLYFNQSYLRNTGSNGQTITGFKQSYVGDLNYDTLQNKVYLNDVLLYDFSLNEGDIYPLTSQYLYIDSNIRVLNIDTIIDPYNIARKVFYIGNINNTFNCNFNSSISCAVIIEGIGNLTGILGPLFDCFEDCTNSLNCASINNNNYTFSNTISVGLCPINNNKKSNSAFPDSNYFYNEIKYHRVFEMSPFDEFQYSVYYKKDTIINNTKHHLLNLKYKMVFPSGPPPNIQGDRPIALIRNDKFNKRVYIKRFGFDYWNFSIPFDSTEKLLYDFSLKVGDYYTPNANTNKFIIDSLFVKKISTLIDPDNIKRNVFILDNKQGDLTWKGIVVEGVGGRNGLLGSELDVMNWSFQEDFLCYSLNNFNYKVYPFDSTTTIDYNTYPCDTRVILSTSNNYLSKINLHPNPASETIYFSDINNINEIMIYNNLGVLVKTEIINDNKIDVKDLASGIYLMYLFSDEKIYHTKFIKTE